MAQALTPEEIDALLAGPAGKPPAGVTPNFANPPSLYTWLILSQCLWISVSTFSFAARITTQWYTERKLHLEDYVIAIAWMTQVGAVTNCVYAANYGIGKHMWDVRLSDFIKTQYFENIISILYVVAMCNIKLAILLQIIRVFIPNWRMKKIFFFGCWTCIVFVLIFYTIDFCLELAQCIPREKIWNPFVEGGTCLQIPAMYESTGVFNIVSDFVILILPLPTIYKLQCGWKKKLAIGGVFATGLFVCVISTLRTYYTSRLFTQMDVSWEISFLGFWIYAELCVGTLVFCLPVFPKFFRLVKHKAHTYISSRLRTCRKSSSSEVNEVLEEGEMPGQGKQQTKPMYPHMVVSLASWEQPELGDNSRIHLGSGVSVTRSVAMADLERDSASRSGSEAQVNGLSATAVDQV